MILFLTPIDLVKKDFYDFSFDRTEFWEKQTHKTKIKFDKLHDFIKNFEPLTRTHFSHGNCEYKTEISYRSFNYEIYYKYKIEMNGDVIMEKIESKSESKNLYNYFYFKGKIINRPFVIYSTKNPTYLFKFSKNELISIIYNEEIYFKLLKDEKNI